MTVSKRIITLPIGTKTIGEYGHLSTITQKKHYRLNVTFFSTDLEILVLKFICFILLLTKQDLMKP